MYVHVLPSALQFIQNTASLIAKNGINDMFNMHSFVEKHMLRYILFSFTSRYIVKLLQTIRYYLYFVLLVCQRL